MKTRWKYSIVFLILVAASVWLAVLTYPKQDLRLVACDVGQGDAILATHKSTQILIDGGSGNKVIDCLGRYMPFWDRQIEVVVLTHPQLDHYGGLIEVFERYDVKIFIANAVDASSQGYQVLKSLVGGSGVKVVNPSTGMVIGGDLMHLDIVYPTQEFLSSEKCLSTDEKQDVLGSCTSSKDPNEFSIVAILRYKKFNALLTGDVQPPVTDEVANILEKMSDHTVNYVKIPHHGSKNGLTKKLLEVVEPRLAVISVGKNSWGHPNEETLSMLKDKKIEILRTDEEGDVIVESDGNSWWVLDKKD
jgi:competence protein ComEC